MSMDTILTCDVCARQEDYEEHDHDAWAEIGIEVRVNAKMSNKRVDVCPDCQIKDVTVDSALATIAVHYGMGDGQ